MTVRSTARGLLLVAVVVLTVWAAAAAAAHSYLRSTDPADGSELRKPPRVVVLNFTDPLVPSSAAVTVTGPEGADRLSPEVQGSRITAAWPPGLDGGEYRVGYRVASQDGHVMQGAVSFRITGGGAAAGATSAGDPSAVPYAQPAAPAPEPGTAPADVPPWVWAVGVLAVAGGAAAALMARRRR